MHPYPLSLVASVHGSSGAEHYQYKRTDFLTRKQYVDDDVPEIDSDDWDAMEELDYSWDNPFYTLIPLSPDALLLDGMVESSRERLCINQIRRTDEAVRHELGEIFVLKNLRDMG